MFRRDSNIIFVRMINRIFEILHDYIDFNIRKYKGIPLNV